jgi:ketosteroid isomerase-like protein
MDRTDVIDRYFAAMRTGAAAEHEMMALFAEDAVYAEPFSGKPPAIGHDAIRARFREGWETPLPDLELDVLRLDVDGPTAVSEWVCRSPALPEPVRGEDRYEIADGLITRLEVRLTEG